VLLGGAVNMHLGFLQKKRTEAGYAQQLKALFKKTMPPGTPLVDAPKQVEAHLQELRKQVQMFGLGNQGATVVLQTLSSQIDPKIPVDLDQFVYSSEEVRIDGYTDSYDSVNQIAEVLGKQGLFSQVEISNAKLASDNSRVQFELQMKLAGTGGGS